MKTIPVVKTLTPEGELLSPAETFPADASATICDGEVYTVYQTGDDVPPAELA